MLERLVTQSNSRYLILLKICMYDYSSALWNDYVFRWRSLEIFEELAKMATVNFGIFLRLKQEGFIDLTQDVLIGYSFSFRGKDSLRNALRNLIKANSVHLIL